MPAQTAERYDRDFRGAAYRAGVFNCNEWLSMRYAPSTYPSQLIEISLGTIVTVYDGAV